MKTLNQWQWKHGPMPEPDPARLQTYENTTLNMNYSPVLIHQNLLSGSVGTEVDTACRAAGADAAH
jgi:hypothetical protein